MTNKVFIIGIDGATFDLIRPWAQDGYLPNLDRLMDKGTWGPLESTVPPMTSPAWPSFATGKYPDKHSVFDFVSAHSGDGKNQHFNVVNATAIQACTLWDILSAYGRKVGVINVPVTFPPHAINGFLISGLLSPSNAQITYPPDLLTRLDDQDSTVPKYRVMPWIQYKPGNESAFIADLLDLIETRADFAARLMQQQPWDFMMVHFLASDVAQHALWRFLDPTHPRYEPESPYKDAILRIYQRIDRALGQLLDLVDDNTTIIVMSDHGFGPLHNVVNLNILLLEKGLLYLKRKPFTQFRAFLFRHGLTPSMVYQWLARFGLQNIISRVSKSTRNAVFNKFLSFDDIDWSRTVAYSLGHIGQIYINVKGREPHGIVERGPGYERACEQVTKALQSLTDANGRPLLDRIIRTKQGDQTNSNGQYADQGPDLHIVLDGYRYISCPLFATDGHIISKQIRGDSGSHRQHGVLIACGPHVRAGAQIQDARIVDLAPTVLHLMGHTIPADMDGHVLYGLLDLAWEDGSPTDELAVTNIHIRQDEYILSDQEEAELEARLKGLGYLG
ncbi:MAG: alkaline phosphatase family protein [Anaerolineae bacterium]|nr:alkaline phosphatase family protein [Anaerolineae bacterium]